MAVLEDAPRSKEEAEDEARALVEQLRGKGSGAAAQPQGDGEQEQLLQQEDIKDVMEALKKLRVAVQKDANNTIELLSSLGVVGVLVDRLMAAPQSHQVYVLQILASLGYVVQKSEERIKDAIQHGILRAIVAKLLQPSTSEGVLLLGVQVVTFLVEDSSERLQQFYENNGVNACLHILRRGCVRSSLLNARVATLLARISEQYPEESITICAKLHQLAALLLKKTQLAVQTVECESGNEDAVRARLAPLEDACVTVCQGLGFLLDGNQWRTKALFDTGAAETLVALVALGHDVSPHLIETVCWTMTYCIANNPALALVLFQVDAGAALSRLTRHSKRLEEGFIHALASVVFHVVEGLCASNATVSASSMLQPLIVNVLAVDSRPEPAGFAGDDIDTLTALHTTGNSLRALRRLAKLKGRATDVLIENDSFAVFAELLKKHGSFPECTSLEILQEVGLVVENQPKLGLHLAKHGICAHLARITRDCSSAQELCNATRALACFVEHNDDVGTMITDMALAAGCERSLIGILCRFQTDPCVDHEVLLNTVGALGYMVKRQSFVKAQDSPRFVAPSREASELHCSACKALINLLAEESIGESLTWNAIWALIYLMNGPSARLCSRAVEEHNGTDLLVGLISSSMQNSPLVCSAAKALYHVISESDTNRIESLPLDVRLKVLTCAARSRPAAQSPRGQSGVPTGTESTPGFGTIDIVIDSNSIAESSVCTMQQFSGDQLRNNGLKIQYVSGEVEHSGIDAGGVRRDWLTRLSEELFDPKFNLVIHGFFPNDSVQISPKPGFGGMSEEDQSKWYRLMGQVLGLSVLYEDPLGVALVPSLCKLLLDGQPEFEDIKFVSKQYYTTFSKLKDLRDSDMDAFKVALQDLTFTVNSRECMMKEAFERDSLVPVSPAAGSHRKSVTAKASSPANRKPLSPEKITSMKQLTIALHHARMDQDRPLLRRLLKIQNKLRQPRSVREDAVQEEEEEEIEEAGEGGGEVQADKESCAGLDDDFAVVVKDHNQDLILGFDAAPEARGRLDSKGTFSSSSSSSSSRSSTNIACQHAQLQRFSRKRKLSTDSNISLVDTLQPPLKRSTTRMKRMMSDLMDGGDLKEINVHNFDRYLEMLTFKLLVENVAPQVAMLKKGFNEVVPREIAVNLLSPQELGELIEGDRNVDVGYWKRYTEYKGGSEADTEQVKWFWEYVSSLGKEERQKLLVWATGWRSIGRTGFSNRKFTIELTGVKSAQENERLPSVATCGFHLWLPMYTTKQQLVSKFRLAMRETSFGNC